jgi:hypothetical protein
MSRRLSGINPLAYLGVEPYTPPAMLQNIRSPTVNDIANLGDFWLVVPPGYSGPESLWLLISLNAGQATWVELYPSSGGAIEFVADTGSANPSMGILNVLGDGVRISTAASGNTITISSDSDVATSYETDSGTATPSGNVLHIIGDSNVQTSAPGSSNVVQISLSVPPNPAASCTYFYYQPTTATAVIGGLSPVIYEFGSDVELERLYDNTGGAVFPGDGEGGPATFTAPATGVYSFQIAFCTDHNNTINASAYLVVTGADSGVYYTTTNSLAGNITTSQSINQGSSSVIIPMTIGDVATWNFWERVGTETSDIVGLGSPYAETPSGYRTWMSGYRLL